MTNRTKGNSLGLLVGLTPIARLSIRSKLVVLIALALIGLAVVVGAGVVGLRSTSNVVTELGENRLQAAVALSAIHSAINKLRDSDREVLRYGTDYNALDIFLRLMEERVEAMGAFRNGWKQYEEIAKQQEEADAWSRLKETRGPWAQAESMLDPILAGLAKPHDLKQHQALFVDYGNRFSETDYTFSHLSDLLESLLAINGKSGNEATRAAASTSSKALFIMLGASAIAILLILVAGTLIVASVTKPLHAMQLAIVAIERDSDFTRRVEVHSDDEVGRTIAAFNSLLGRVQHSFREILESIGHVSSSAQSLAAGSHQLASSSSDQSASSSAMVASVQEMTSSIAKVSDSSGRALDLAQTSGNISSEGGEIITQSVREMTRIAVAVTQTSSTIIELEHHSNQISTVVQVIKELAEQTNLLALNAAIEAARAGEQGRGFAVVADEVRKLAERTTNSTQEISGVINQIQTATGDAVTQMKSIVNDVTFGKDLADKAGQRVAEITNSVEQVIAAVNEISASLYEQRQASQSISSNVENVAEKSDAISSAASDASAAASSLEHLAGRMSAAIRVFQV